MRIVIEVESRDQMVIAPLRHHLEALPWLKNVPITVRMYGQNRVQQLPDAEINERHRVNEKSLHEIYEVLGWRWCPYCGAKLVREPTHSPTQIPVQPSSSDQEKET